MTRKTQFIYVVGIPFFISLVIYMAFRPSETNLHVFAKNLPFLSHIWPTSPFNLPLGQNSFTDFFIFNLPGAIWMMSVTAICYGFSFASPFWKKIVFIPLLYVGTLEVLQHFHITDGTFDFLDILVAFPAFFLGKWLGTTCFKQNPLPIKLSLLFILLAFLSLFMADVY